ncbi:MAG: hypothetical protein WCE91_02995, partial [Nitrososphaeraceae archaeon]
DDKKVNHISHLIFLLFFLIDYRSYGINGIYITRNTLNPIFYQNSSYVYTTPTLSTDRGLDPKLITSRFRIWDRIELN